MAFRAVVITPDVSLSIFTLSLGTEKKSLGLDPVNREGVPA
jgi:hypothetical protein